MNECPNKDSKLMETDDRGAPAVGKKMLLHKKFNREFISE